MIGLRYTRSKRRNGFLSFVSGFALLGMGLGVFALIVVLSVMNGFDHELKQRILRVIPHATLTGPRGLDDWQALAEQLENTPHLEGSAPYIGGKGLLTYAGSVRGIEIQGIDPAHEGRVSPIAEAMMLGELQSLQPGEYGIVMGRLAAQFMGLNIGDLVTVTLPQFSITPAGVFPRTKRFVLVGVFEVNAPIDQTLTLVHITDAQKLFRRGNKVDGLRLRFDDIYRAPEAVKQLSIALDGEYQARDWSMSQENLFKAVKMEKTMTGLMLSIIVLVAAFNIVTSLVMMVTEKRSDIAVLRTMGLKRRDIVKIFMVQGVSMGGIGIGVGCFFGVLCALYLPQIFLLVEKITGFQLFDPDVFFVSFLPSVWQWQDTVKIAIGAFSVSVLACIYPALRAARIEPSEALRYDT